MIETVVFVIGVAVFAITVWGTVMAGGLRLTRIQIEQNPDFAKVVEDEQLKKPFPYDAKY